MKKFLITLICLGALVTVLFFMHSKLPSKVSTKPIQSNANSQIQLNNYKDLPNLSDLNIEPRALHGDSILKLMDHPISYSSNPNNNTGFMITSSHELLLLTLNSVHEGINKDKTYYAYKLPSSLSNNLKVFCGTENNALIVDVDNGIIAQISNFSPSNPLKPADPVIITQSTKFADTNSIKDLNVLGDSLVGDSNVVDFADDSNNVYTYNLTDNKLLNSWHFDGWNTIYEVNEQDVDNVQVDHRFLYQTDENHKILRKFDLTYNREIYQLSIEQTPIHGQIEKAVFDFNIIYILVNDDGKQVWYQTNEKTRKQFSKTNHFLDGTTWNHIDNAWYYMDGQDFNLAIYDDRSSNSIKFLPVLQGWTAVQ